MQIQIKNGSLILKDKIAKNANLLIADEKIKTIGKKNLPVGAISIDAKGCFVSPGLIDAHIHGSAQDIFKNEVSSGTTSIVVVELTGKLDGIYEKVSKIKEFKTKNKVFGPNVLGVHIEGPYLSRVRAGAQDKRYIRKPSAREAAKIVKACSGELKIMTVAPEIDGAIGVIKELRKRGVIASLGHSDATYEEGSRGISAGIRYATHIFNGIRPVDRREPGATTAALLDDRVMAEVIADLIHVHPALLKVLIQTKGIDKVVAITDSVRGEQPVGAKKCGDVYRLKNGKLAGSNLTMIKALENLVKACGLDIVDAVRLVSANPAKVLGVGESKGSIEVGKDADIVIFNKNFDVKMTIVRGNIVYEKGKR